MALRRPLPRCRHRRGGLRSGLKAVVVDRGERRGGAGTGPGTPPLPTDPDQPPVAGPQPGDRAQGNSRLARPAETGAAGIRPEGGDRPSRKGLQSPTTYRLQWEKAAIAPVLSPEEARFWLAAIADARWDQKARQALPIWASGVLIRRRPSRKPSA